VSDRTIRAEPLTRSAFAPFGQVIETAGAEHFPINAGNAERYNDLAKIELDGTNARPLISIFKGKSYSLPYTLRMVERHPFGSQAFYPLQPKPFLVTVAPDNNGTPGKPRAFLTAPGQGINLGMNVWHGTLTPLEGESSFLVIDRAGDGVNLVEHDFDQPWTIVAAT
jgi:ureidoglycolate lyase